MKCLTPSRSDVASCSGLGTGRAGNIQLLSDGVRNANRNEAIFVASRGNDDGTYQSLPATYNDDWVINVGGTGTDGEYASSPSTPAECCPSIGFNIDIAAPYPSELIKTLNSDGGYQDFCCTSAAAPHVSGAASLLLSYLNNPTDENDYQNLAPEDVEHILKVTATDTNMPGYDDLTGFGRLDIGEAINYVNKNERQLIHFGTDNNDYTRTSTLVDSDETVELIEPYFNDESLIFFQKGDYLVDIYRVEAIINHDLPSSVEILASWGRHSSSDVFPWYTLELTPHHKVGILDIDNQSATLAGIVYQMKNTMGEVIGWLPTTPENAELTYSVLIEGNISTNTEEVLKDDFDVVIYPNPSFNSKLNIKITSGKFENELLEVKIFDISGRALKEVENISILNGQTFEIDVSNLSKGVYFVKLKKETDAIIKKWIKIQ